MIYVMSDIHGNLQRFQSVMKQIRLRKTDTLYILGDVIDRNPDGLDILRKIMKKENIKMLLGNHEHMLLDALYYHPYPPKPLWRDTELRTWYSNGGNITHERWKKMRKSTRDEIVQYLLNLPINIPIEVKGKRYLLVHGKPMKSGAKDPITEQDFISYSVWNRYRKKDSGPEDTTVIFGHTPTIHYLPNEPEMKIWYGERLVGIDCGCAYPEGRLSCLCLNNGKEYYSKDEPSLVFEEIKEGLSEAIEIEKHEGNKE